MPKEKLVEQLANKCVLVTGATGFIGSHLVERLVNVNARVVATGSDLGFRPQVKRLVEQGHVHFVELEAFWDPAEIDKVRSDFEDVEYVVNLAYVMPRGNSLLEKVVDDLHRNVLGTLQFIQLLPETISKICFASSVMVYGSTPPLPVSETDDVNPESVYSCGKFATENYLRLYTKEREISTTVLRFATVYGPWEIDPRAIPNFIRRVLAGKPPEIFGKGDDVRDYVHVSDVVEATLLALADDTFGYKVFNVGSGEGFSTFEIAEKVIKLADGQFSPILKPATNIETKIVCDINHSIDVLGYEPKVNIDKGIINEIKFFKDNPKLWRET